MVSKSAHVPMLPMSTIMMMLMLAMTGITLLVLLLNPLTMFFLHIFKPRFAASLAHNTFFCSSRVCAFYTKLALKWPFRWSRWWLTKDDLAGLSQNQQKDYYTNVNSSEEVFWSLRPDVWVEIMKDKTLQSGANDEIAEKIRTRNDLFEAMLDLALISQQTSRLLQCYLHYGTLPKPQMVLLVEKVCEEGKKHDLGTLADGLSEYVRRCGISNELLTKIQESTDASESAKDLIDASNICYKQRIFTKNLRALASFEEVRNWVSFCSVTSDICAEAEQEMSLKQYRFFHESGHHLEAGAIAHLLWHGNKEMAEQIFRYEPKFGILDEKIDFILDKHDYLRPLLQKIISDTEEELSLKLNEGEFLLNEEVSKLFDCPSAPTLILDYLTKWTMPDELQMRMFELPNAKEVIELYMDLGQTGKEYILIPEVQKKAIKEGLLPTTE